MSKINDLLELAELFAGYDYKITKLSYISALNKEVKVNLTDHAIARFRLRCSKIIKVPNLNYKKFLIFLFNSAEKVKNTDPNDRNKYTGHGQGGTVTLVYWPFEFLVHDTVLVTVRLLGKYKRLMGGHYER